MSPFGNSIRPQYSVGAAPQAESLGLGAFLERLQATDRAQPRGNNPFLGTIPQTRPSAEQMTYDQAMSRNMQQDVKSPEVQARIDAAIEAGPTASRPAQIPAQPVNPFEGNEQYQALMEYQKSMAPQQEQLDRLNELRTAFEGTGGYKDYRIQQMEQQMQRMQQPRMGMGLGGMRPMGMQPYQGFGRPQFPMQMPVPRGGYMGQQMMNQPRQFGAMGYNQPQPYQQQQYGMMGGYQQNPYQQMRPQPQQFGGYGMGQQMGGYGGYGGMSNPYQPQQMGSYNPNNSMGYGQQQMNQFQGYML